MVDISRGARVLQGNRLALVGGLFAAVTVPLLGLFALSVPAIYARKLDPLPHVTVGLGELGIPVGAYATGWTLILVAFALACVATAGLIVWRRPREPVAWSVALLLVCLGTVNAPAVEALVWQRPALEPAGTLGFQLLLASLVLFLFTFPDGRFHPRWSWVLVAVAVPGLALARGSVARPIPDALFVALMVGLLGGLAAQVHRYRRVSDVTQRQQTREVLLAVAVAVLAQLVLPALEAIPAVARPGAWAAVHDLASVLLISVGYGLVVVAIARAVLRRRLWDLDPIVNRALVYGGLTVLLLGLYVGIVTALGQSLGAPGDASGSLLAAAMVALAFAPLRDRLQRGANRLLYGQRDEPYRVLSDLGQRLEATLAPDGVLQTIADTVAGALRSPRVEVLVDRDGISNVKAIAGRDATAGGDEDALHDELVTVPLLHHHQRVGAVRVAPRGPHETFNAADRALLDDLARQAAAAVHAVGLTEELRRSRERLVTAREEERRRLRRDLHDGLGPALASMTLQAETAGELVVAQPVLATSILTDLVEQLQVSTVEVRGLVHDLRPAVLDDRGLADALRTFMARSGSARLRCELHLPDPMPELSAAAEVAVYRIVQEAVTNVLRHANATVCTVRLADDEGDGVSIEVADDGVGIHDAVVEGVGLRSMRERAAELGGTCHVQPTADGGTLVRANLPRTTPAGAVR